MNADSITAADEEFLQRALALARRGAGRVAPNPLVGALVVRERAVLGKGYHGEDGPRHAEVVAIEQARAAGADPRGGTLYLSLEPCCHTGKTGPCTSAILEAGITRVVACMRDPNPRVSGQGFAALEAAGVTVAWGALEAEARGLNAPFIHWITTRRPFVTLKAAVSADGYVARPGGGPTPITGDAARRHLHQVRFAADAVLVGIGTVLADDPRLTARPDPPPDPPKVLIQAVLDANLRLPPTSRLVTQAAAGEGRLLLYHQAGVGPATRARLARAGAETVALGGSGTRLPLEKVLTDLGLREVTHLLVEGGPAVWQSFLDADLVQRAQIYQSPHRLEGGVPMLPGRPVPDPVASLGLRGVVEAVLTPDRLLEGCLSAAASP